MSSIAKFFRFFTQRPHTSKIPNSELIAEFVVPLGSRLQEKLQILFWHCYHTIRTIQNHGWTRWIYPCQILSERSIKNLLFFHGTMELFSDKIVCNASPKRIWKTTLSSLEMFLLDQLIWRSNGRMQFWINLEQHWTTTSKKKIWFLMGKFQIGEVTTNFNFLQATPSLSFLSLRGNPWHVQS